jgi:hypothetical protein
MISTEEPYRNQPSAVNDHQEAIYGTTRQTPDRDSNLLQDPRR